jgi:predicted NBD/HSP70 family sugar kinase
MSLGIDVGGTKILAAIVENGQILKSWRMKTQDGRVIESIKNIIRDAGEESIGIGVPCYLRNGICVKAPNISELSGKDMGKIFKDAIILNDATAMAYGEYILRDKKYDPLLLISLGTGIGSALISRGMPYFGRGSAMELGHIKGFSDIPCSCGKVGCFETIAGGRYVPLEYMAKRAKEDEEALRFFENYGKTLAKGLSYAIQLLDPEIVVIGGGISNSYALFIDSLKNELENLLSYISVDDIIFEKAKSESSGALGAALLSEKRI